MQTAKTMIASVILFLLAACGTEDEPSTLSATWTFESGDCASNGVETVHIVATPQAGTALDVELPCAAGTGDLGELPEDGESYSISAEGLDASGVVRAENFGQTASFPQGRPLYPIDITLHPKTVDVVVSWSVQGAGGCPGAVVLPYFITLYEAPAVGGELTAKVTEVQESCSSGAATLMRIAPGSYVVEVDSRAVTPAVRGTAPVTVEAGQDAAVSVDL